MRKIRVLLVIVLATFMVNTSHAALNHVGTSVANFLKIGVGGKAVAMGDAFVAIADDPSALYWNPGGLGFQQNIAVNFSYTNWILDTKHNFLGVVLPMRGVGTVGLSIISFSSGDIEETTIYKPHGTGRVFSASDLSIGLSLSRRLTDRYSVGVTMKYLSEKLALESASSVALDIGSVFILSYRYNVRMGIALSNFGGNMKMDGLNLETDVSTDFNKLVEARLKTYSWPLPLTFRVGLAADILKSSFHRLTVAADVNDPRDFKARGNLGFEYAIKSMFFLRGGYKIGYDEDTFSAGVGFNYKVKGVGRLIFDYSFSDMGRLDNITRFTIGLSF